MEVCTRSQGAPKPKSEEETNTHEIAVDWKVERRQAAQAWFLQRRDAHIGCGLFLIHTCIVSNQHDLQVLLD
jgi:hypothetical protein